MSNSLSHSSHIANIINAASQRSNLILCMFITRDNATLKSAFATYIRLLLEYNTVLWSPQYVSDVRTLEKVKKSTTGGLLSTCFYHPSYSERF